MEKYRVEAVGPYLEHFCQLLDLVGVSKQAVTKWNRFRIRRSFPLFKKGDVVNVYSFRGIDGLHAFKAYSYRLNGKMFVDIQTIPETQTEIEHFYDDLSWSDALRLKYDVMCALRNKNIKPTLDAANNLRLLLFETSMLIKSK